MLAVPPDRFDLTGSEGKQKGTAGLSRQVSTRSQPPARASNRLIWLDAGHRYRAEV
jgi:hypothetical protein